MSRDDAAGRWKRCLQPLVVGTFQRSVWEQLQERTMASADPATPLDRHTLALGHLREQTITVAHFPIGAPAVSL
jgi:hypothetical protein